MPSLVNLPRHTSFYNIHYPSHTRPAIMSLTAPFQILTPEEHDALGLERVPNWTARNPLYK